MVRPRTNLISQDDILLKIYRETIQRKKQLTEESRTLGRKRDELERILDTVTPSYHETRIETESEIREREEKESLVREIRTRLEILSKEIRSCDWYPRDTAKIAGHFLDSAKKRAWQRVIAELVKKKFLTTDGMWLQLGRKGKERCRDLLKNTKAKAAK